MENVSSNKGDKMMDNKLEFLTHSNTNNGKENYFFKKKFGADSKKIQEKQLILSKLSALQNYSNHPPFPTKKEPSRASLSKQRETNAYPTEKAVTMKVSNGFSFQKSKKTIPTTSKRKNKSLSIKKFSLEKSPNMKIQGFSQSFAQNSKDFAKKIEKNKTTKISSDEIFNDLDKRMQEIMREVEAGSISILNAHKKLLKTLINQKRVINENTNAMNGVSLLELNEFLENKIKITESIIQKEKRVTESKGCQTTSSEFDMNQFVTIFKEFSSELLREGPKAEFKLPNLIDYFLKKGQPFEEIDFEAQKLLKSFCDTIQKQLIFEEVIKILEEENIQIDDFLQTSYERVMQQLIGEREQQNAELSSDRNENINHETSPALSHNNFKEAKSNLNETGNKLKLTIDLQNLDRKNSSGTTPHGFHQEFIGLAKEFSPSWRAQIECESKKYSKNK